MRRRRHVLQVSTFPFLAVLLCTMGSLILLLVVIDRRAKAVARAKAALALAAQTPPSPEDSEARAAELEERRQRLHALLEHEMGEVEAESRAVQEKIATATANITSVNTENRELSDRLQTEKNRLAQVHQILADRKREMERSDQQSKATEEQRRKLTLDLVLLERT